MEFNYFAVIKPSFAFTNFFKQVIKFTFFMVFIPLAYFIN
jgi:hypothetical protein